MDVEEEAEARLLQLVSQGKTLPHDVGREESRKREEVDDRLYRAGSDFFHRHFFSMFVSMLAGLLTLMFLPGVVTILHLTQRSSSPTTAFRCSSSP